MPEGRLRYAQRNEDKDGRDCNVYKMSLYRLLKHIKLEPEQCHIVARAYESVLIDLKLQGRDDPVNELIAKKILDYAQRGELDAIRLRQIVREEMKDLKNR